MPTSIYHITHVENLPRIIATNGLWCDAQRQRQAFASVGIAHQSLKDRRARTPVRKRSGEQVALGGVLADYVPFHFANRSPMLYSLHTGFVAGYDGGQASVIHLVSTIERVTVEDRRWCFTNGHAVEALTEFFDDSAELNQVDWQVIESWSWKNTEGDPDRKRRKQAEFLVHESFPWLWVERIGVVNAALQKRVQEIIGTAGELHSPPVEVQGKWYYS